MPARKSREKSSTSLGHGLLNYARFALLLANLNAPLPYFNYKRTATFEIENMGILLNSSPIDLRNRMLQLHGSNMALFCYFQWSESVRLKHVGPFLFNVLCSLQGIKREQRLDSLWRHGRMQSLLRQMNPPTPRPGFVSLKLAIGGSASALLLQRFIIVLPRQGNGVTFVCMGP
ncbi:hypothetical protein VNO77_03840 [Canavalia gladiata]|uniref:Uncharacterized protein n=1 Tax=Canavalia gladiata TaxID=3824 RepID=A0AAN9RCL5_CANGL